MTRIFAPSVLLPRLTLILTSTFQCYNKMNEVLVLFVFVSVAVGKEVLVASDMVRRCILYQININKYFLQQSGDIFHFRYTASQ